MDRSLVASQGCLEPSLGAAGVDNVGEVPPGPGQLGGVSRRDSSNRSRSPSARKEGLPGSSSTASQMIHA